MNENNLFFKATECQLSTIASSASNEDVLNAALDKQERVCNQDMKCGGQGLKLCLIVSLIFIKRERKGFQLRIDLKLLTVDTKQDRVR
jgi:hypothetical protein